MVVNNCVVWCELNRLRLDISNTNKLVVDFRISRAWVHGYIYLETTQIQKGRDTLILYMHHAIDVLRSLQRLEVFSSLWTARANA